MASFNKVILVGNLTRDPELRTAGSGGVKVASFGLAVNDTYRDRDGNAIERPVFIDVDVWDRQAETAAQYLRKGRCVLVEGRLQMDTWEKDGQKRSKLKIRASAVKFMPQAQPQGQQAAHTAAPAAPQDAPAEIPF